MNHSSVVSTSWVISASVPYESSTWCINRRTISGVIHSRACCAPRYSVEGRWPSRTLRAPLVTLTARIGWPLSDLPIDTSLAILGKRAAVAVTSSRMPPGSL
jgi:hypothetical protein